jgi:transglutaminase-like putative cysteine protease
VNLRTREYLEPTLCIDCDNPYVQQKTADLTEEQKNTIEKAKSLFYFVRDKIKYNPYAAKSLPEHYRASNTLAQREGYCVQKAVLLCALARAAGIPTRLGFATIRNNIVPERLAKLMGTDIFVYHGYVEFYIEGKWVKATPAFDLRTCEKNRIIPVEFDGKNDAVFHLYNRDGKLHIEYLKDIGRYSDIPLDEIWDMWIQTYGSKDPKLPDDNI